MVLCQSRQTYSEREIVRGTSVIQLGSRLSLSYLYTQEERLHFVAAHGSVPYLNSHPLSSRAQITRPACCLQNHNPVGAFINQLSNCL